MKTLKTIALGLLIAVTFNAAKAAPKNDDNEKLSVSYTVNTYVNAVTHGQLSGLDEMIDNNAKFTSLRGQQLLSFNKNEEIAFMKNTENVEQDCLTTSAVTESNADFTVVKVDMKYSNFTRTNYVTMANTIKGWKITNVYSVFK